LESIHLNGSLLLHSHSLQFFLGHLGLILAFTLFKEFSVSLLGGLNSGD
jgi:hypothetical protein